jgi:hypothetical protein
MSGFFTSMISAICGNITSVLQHVAQLNRGSLQPQSLGLTLAEARSILAGIERTIVENRQPHLLHNNGFALLAAKCVPAKVVTRLSFARRLAN